MPQIGNTKELRAPTLPLLCSQVFPSSEQMNMLIVTNANCLSLWLLITLPAVEVC